MSLTYNEIVSYFNGEKKPIVGIDYYGMNMKNDINKIKNLVILWIRDFFGPYYDSLTKFFVMHRIIFDIEHIRQFDEATEKIYNKYYAVKDNKEAQMFLIDLLYKMVDRMASRYRPLEIQEATAVVAQEVNAEVHYTAEVKVENDVEIISIEEPEEKEVEFQSEVIIARGQVFAQTFHKKNRTVLIDTVSIEKIEREIATNDLLDGLLDPIETQRLLSTLYADLDDFCDVQNRIFKHVYFKIGEIKFLKYFYSKFYFHKRSSVLFIEIEGEVSAVLLSDSCFASFFKEVFRLYVFESRVNSYYYGLPFGDRLSKPLQLVYSHLDNYYHYGFNVHELRVMKPAKSFRENRSSVYYVHTAYFCIQVTVYDYLVKQRDTEYALDSLLMDNEAWYRIKENYLMLNGAYQEIIYYFDYGEIIKFWHATGSNIFDNQDFSLFFEKLTDLVMCNEYLPWMMFVSVKPGVCHPSGTMLNDQLNALYRGRGVFDFSYGSFNGDAWVSD